MENLKEFESVYSYDENDLLSLGVGSGVHLDRDVLLNFSFLDRESVIVKNKDQMVKNKYMKSIIFDIADINDNIIAKNYQSGYMTSLSITEKENELIFGQYEKDFCVNFRVEDFTTDIVSSGKYYIYGNPMYISQIKTYDSLGETLFNEPLGPYMEVEFDSGSKVFSGKMILTEKESEGLPERFVISGVKNHPEMPSGFQDHYWEASLTYEFNGADLDPNPSYPSYIQEIENNQSWTLLFNDYSPSGYFLLSKTENEKNNPYGIYTDAYNSAEIRRYQREPISDPSGRKSEDSIALEISYINSQEFTKKEGLEVYSYNGEELSPDQFSYIRTLDGNHSENIEIEKSAGLVDNQKTWLKFKPKSPFSDGEPWVVGPLLHTQTGEPDASFEINQVNLKSSDGAANINFKKGSILDVLDHSSGVLDRIFVNKEDGTEKSIYENDNGLTFSYNTVPVDENGFWEKTYFEYSLTMIDKSNPYEVISKNIKLQATGVATSGENEGLPLFKVEGNEDQEGENLNITPVYSYSGVSLLVNTGQAYDSYKFHKTSF